MNRINLTKNEKETKSKDRIVAELFRFYNWTRRNDLVETSLHNYIKGTEVALAKVQKYRVNVKVERIRSGYVHVDS